MSTVEEMSNKLSFSQQGKKWNSATDAEDVVSKIKAYKSLKTLELDGNTLGVPAAAAIADALAGHPEFERALWKDLFTGRLKTEIPVALKHLFDGLIKANAKLIELDLSDNALGPVGVAGMIEFMKSPVCYSLQELKLNNNGLGSGGAAMLAKALFYLKDASEKAGTPLNLKVFIVGRNKLENGGAASFCEFFSAVGTLEVIQMPQNHIFYEGIDILAKSFSKNKHLKTINLNDNNFTVKGAKSMIEYLPELENLETINFGDCLLRNNGAEVLAKGLVSGHHNLQNLHLDGNEIRLSGALAIVDAIANKPNLKFLGLEYNELGEEIPEELTEKLNEFGKYDVTALDNNEDPDSDDCESTQENDYELSEEFELVRIEDQEDFEGEHDEHEASASDFLLQPSISVLMQLGPSASVQLIHDLKLGAVTVAENLEVVYEEALVRELLTGVMKVSSVSCTKNDEIQMSEDCCKKLWVEAFSMVDKLGTNFFSNVLLIHLGEVKSEDKKFKIEWDIRKCLQNLVWLITLPCVPSEVKRAVMSVLSLPGSKLATHRNEVQKLLAIIC